jgi:hypothetical protein
MMIRLAIVEEITKKLTADLLPGDHLEHGAFCLVHVGNGKHGKRLLVSKVILPPADAWECQGSDMLRPSAKWISAAISNASQAQSGLLFIHSHPNPLHPVGFSVVDEASFRSLAETIAPMLDGPFTAAVIHPEGWAAVLWDGDRIVPIDRIVSVGRTLSFLNPPPLVDNSALDDRQRDALGIVHDHVRTLTAAIVGLGGLGSPTAEQLVRMGVAEVIAIDHDLLDTSSNVRRVFGSRVSDLRHVEKRTKVDVVSDHLEEIGLGVRIRPVNGDVRTEEVFRHLLDADVVFSGTDTHGSRAILNELASTYLLPVIDVGVRVGAKENNHLSGLLAEVRVLTPTTPCLWCRGTINADVIRAENLPSKERQKLEREGYIVGGVGSPVPSVVALTVLGSGLATSALLALLAEEGEVAPSGYWVDGFLGDSHVSGPDQPKATCRCRQQLGLGDSSPPPFIPS